jgi:hypothetical protein
MNISPSHKFLYVTDGTEAAMFQVSGVQPIVVSDADTLEFLANEHQLGATAASDSFVSAVVTVTGNASALMLALGKEIAFGSSPVIDVLALARTIVPAATCAVTLT